MKFLNCRPVTVLLWALVMLLISSFSISQDDNGDLVEITKEEAVLAAQDSPCPQFWIDFCVNEAYRFCYVDQEAVTERCGACLPGSFEWNTLCVSSGAFQLLTFLGRICSALLERFVGGGTFAIIEKIHTFHR
jgi:hypothetical protein